MWWKSLSSMAMTVVQCVRKIGYQFWIPWKRDIHIHVPDGATPKMVQVQVSQCVPWFLLTGNPVRADVAMTGKISLRGKITIGGLKEKLFAAHRGDIKLCWFQKIMWRFEEIPDTWKKIAWSCGRNHWWSVRLGVKESTTRRHWIRESGNKAKHLAIAATKQQGGQLMTHFWGLWNKPFWL